MPGFSLHSAYSRTPYISSIMQVFVTDPKLIQFSKIYEKFSHFFQKRFNKQYRNDGLK